MSNDPETAWSVAPHCGSLLAEKTADYDLYFAEFDDQGWLYASPQFNDAGSAMNYAVTGIRNAMAQGQGVSIVVFVHGWKHSAASNDADVRVVRRVLTGVSHIERVTGGCKRRVIGVYAGWRGSSLDVDPQLQDLTFWDRKDAASRVAEGSIRELFARIRSAQIDGNQRHGRLSRNPCEFHPMRLMIVGHSFGGLIVYSVLSEALIRDIADMQHASATGAEVPGASREGDLVLLVNPAIEATKFHALAQISTNVDKWERYHAPLFVSITSIDDLATRMAFRFGRQLSTAFESYTGPISHVQRRANLETLGQDSDYINMELDTLEHYNATVPPAGRLAPARSCDGYEALSLDPTATAAEKLRGHVERERRMFEEFRSSLGEPPDASRAYPRQFCGDHTLVLSWSGSDADSARWIDPNAPIWNIRTSKPIVNDHGDVTNAHLWQFVRQLYYDSEAAHFSPVRR